MNKTQPLEQHLSTFSERQLQLILENTYAVQLTEGCSIGCSFCGVEAVFKKRGEGSKIPFGVMERLQHAFPNQFQPALLYYASDPFDYRDENYQYRDVHNLFSHYIYVSTAVPKGTEVELLRELFEAGKDAPNLVDRVSVSKMNLHRLIKAGPQALDVLDPKQQKKTHYRLKKRLEPSEKWGALRIFDLVEDGGLFTSLGLFQFQANVSMERQDQVYLFPFREGSRSFHTREEEADKLVRLEGTLHAAELQDGSIIIAANRPVDSLDVLAWYKVVGSWSNEKVGITKKIPSYWDLYVRGERLLTMQAVIKNLGEKNKDNLSKKGIGCFNGCLLKPDGAYTVQTVTPTKEHPTGQVLRRIDSDQFRILEKEYIADQPPWMLTYHWLS